MVKNSPSPLLPCEKTEMIILIFISFLCVAYIVHRVVINRGASIKKEKMGPFLYWLNDEASGVVGGEAVVGGCDLLGSHSEAQPWVNVQIVLAAVRDDWRTCEASITLPSRLEIRFMVSSQVICSSDLLFAS